MNSNNSNKNTQHNQYGNEFSLFVGDLPYDCSDDKLQRLFQAKFKSVKRVQIIRNKDGSSRGFGFVSFEERSDLNVALAEGMVIDNTTLRLDAAHRTMKNRSRFNSFNSTGSHNSNQHNHHPDEFRLFVGGLPFDCSDDKLQRLVQSKYKSVKRVRSR